MSEYPRQDERGNLYESEEGLHFHIAVRAGLQFARLWNVIDFPEDRDYELFNYVFVDNEVAEEGLIRIHEPGTGVIGFSSCTFSGATDPAVINTFFKLIQADLERRDEF